MSEVDEKSPVTRHFANFTPAKEGEKRPLVSPSFAGRKEEKQQVRTLVSSTSLNSPSQEAE